MRVQSKTTLTGALLLLAAHLLVFPSSMFAFSGPSTHPSFALLATPFAASSLLALVSAFSSNSAFRAIAVTAAAISTLVPIWLIIFFVGIFYLPGITIIAVAAVRSVFAVQGARRIVAPAIGFVAGVMFLVSYWPLVTAFNLCDDQQLECLESISGDNVALGLGFVGMAVSITLFAGAFLGRDQT